LTKAFNYYQEDVNIKV